MASAMDRLASEGSFPTYDPFSVEVANTSKVSMFVLQCCCCGFEPDDQVVPPRVCPKCHSQSWERFTRPGSILANANRY
jgi:hypothetical protein